MSIENYPRLLAAAKEFNLDQNELINILVKTGFNKDDLKPTYKLSKEMYEVLQRNCTENQEITHDKAKPKRIDLSQIPGFAEFKSRRKNIPLQKSENKITQPEEDINLKPIDNGRGKLKFFDYNKNNFGYIVDVKTNRGRFINKIRVTREMMPIKRINDETDILFTLNDSNIGLYVSNVVSINNADIYDIKEYIKILDDSEINKCIKNSVDINITDDIEGIKNIFNNYLLENPNEEIESNLWEIGLTDKINYQYAFKIFLEKNCTIEKRVKILHQNDEYKCCELIVEYCNLNSIKKTFDLLESIIKHSNELPNSFELSEYINNKEFISKIKFNKLIEYFIDFAERSKSEIENIELYEAGYSNEINISELLKHSGTISKNIIEGVLRKKVDDSNFVFSFFNEFIDFTKEEELIWCYSFLNKNLKSDLFNSIDENIYKKTSPEMYFKLWVKELSKIFPSDFIKLKISKEYKIFEDAENWFAKKLISKEDFISFLNDILNANKNNITNIEFNLAYNIISYLISVESRHIWKKRLN